MLSRLNKGLLRDLLLKGLTPIFGAQRALLRRSAILRRASYNSLPREALVVANTPNGPFVCCAQDRIIGGYIYAYGTFELENALRALEIVGRSRDDMVFVDVGANIGPICLPLVKRGLVSRAIAIEPDPLNFKLLQANVILNGLADAVGTIQCAAGSEDDQHLLFERSDSNFGDHRVLADAPPAGTGQDGRRIIDVKGFRLDTLLQNEDAGKVVLWIDAQGYEGFVLAGAERFLKLKVPTVFEFWPYGLRKSGSFDHLKNAVLGAPYTRLFDLSNKKPASGSVSRSAFDELFEKYDHGPDSFTDLLIL